MSNKENTLIHDACDECGNKTDGLMTCHFVDGETTKLCPDCIIDSGFCLGCGEYCSGISSFDFSDIPGYCDNCRDEIKSNFDEDENNKESYCGYNENT
ncbi:MAG: hypothetical protein UZ05_CHB002001011 [Chlorobi bacterium OLB5]|nr:MAG: hypothetical protein UZ05_CHB002001011 [Chlorobi bacterium OLB5]